MPKSTPIRTGKTSKAIPSFRNTREFEALSDADKERVFESYDKPVKLSDTRPLSAADRRRHQSAAKRGRRMVGNGAERINVTIERGLLQRVDVYAASHHLSRAALISHGLKMAMGE